ncbi:hypothetical protein [Asticcacaulis tiandongensis]|uniref:hypothetical protein n=1 Tax=Asticcacaulis tiandongensis TaxID=2565365 RepID=UPI0015E85C7B|nr:hypothetical protein [Asticcacaulis tiandongensis]
MTDETLEGKRLLLTGGTTGIGRETLAMLVRAGHRWRGKVAMWYSSARSVPT